MTIVVDEAMVAVWYVAYAGADVVMSLRREATRFRFTYQVMAYNSNRSDRQSVISPRHLGTSAAMSFAKEFLETLTTDKSGPPLEGSWEVIRGGRTLNEFAEAIGRMPMGTRRAGNVVWEV